MNILYDDVLLALTEVGILLANRSRKHKGDIRQIILHEIAHIDTAKYCNQRHNPQFWKRLEYLTNKFLKKGLDKHQLKHKEYMTNGYYSLKYK